MMPYRHTFDLEKLIYVRDIVKKLRVNNEENSYFKRFYYATITSIAKLKNPERINTI